MDSQDFLQPFSKIVRLRACGILIENEAILLVKHVGLGEAGFLWSPPGGGLEFGESCRIAVQREFHEETGLEVVATDFWLFHEHIDQNLHAVELFFKVFKNGGVLSLGTDPELHSEKQMMTDLRFWRQEEIKAKPSNHFHKRTLDFFG